MPKGSNRKYFEFLAGVVLEGGQSNISKDFLWSLYEADFRWTVPNDGNRESDGLNLREEYEGRVFSLDRDWTALKNSPASVLEVLIAIARRADYEVAREDDKEFAPCFFWEMVMNLGLEVWSDGYPSSGDMIFANKIKLDKWLDRRFGKYGKGSIFPLKRLKINQRETEIWYQMMSYLRENYPY